MSLCICSFSPALYSPWEITTTFRIIYIHELCFEHKVKSPFPHNETFYDRIILLFNSCHAPCIFFFLQSDRICHIAYAVRSFWPFRTQSYWFNLCLMLWSHGHLSSCSLRNSFKYLKALESGWMPAIGKVCCWIGIWILLDQDQSWEIHSEASWSWKPKNEESHKEKNSKYT